MGSDTLKPFRQIKTNMLLSLLLSSNLSLIIRAGYYAYLLRSMPP